MSLPQLTIAGAPVWIAVEDLGGNAVVETVTSDGPKAVVMFKCNYADRYAVFKGLMGTSVASGRSIIRTRPLAYPPSPNLYCMGIGETVGIKPRVDSSGWVTYAQVMFPATFEIPKYQFDANSPDGQNDPSGKPYTTTKFSVSAEVVTPPDGAFFIGPFSPTGKKVEEASIGIVKASVEVTITRHCMPYVPLDEMMTAIGEVNSDTIILANHTFPKGTLLLAGMENEPNSDPGGLLTQEITYKLLGKTDDWNKFIAKDGSLQFINTKNDGTGSPPYIYSNYWTILP